MLSKLSATQTYGDHSFGTFERNGVRNVSFSEKSSNVLNE